MKRLKSLILLIMGLPIITASVSAAEVKQLSMGSATVGGIFYNIASPVAQCVNQALPEVNITAEFTEGTTENLRLMSQGKIELAVITPQIGAYARQGKAMFKGQKIDFRVIARLLPNANVWAVRADSGVKNIADLRGHKVAVGPASGGLGVLARTQLAANGIDYKKDITPLFMGSGEMADALTDGTVEASFLTGELATRVASTHKIRLLNWPSERRLAFLARNPNYGEYQYPPGYFKGVDYPVTTVDNGIQFICQVDMDDALAYKLAKAVCENIPCIASIYAPAKAMNPAWAAKKLGNPYHPGAIKYYKEIGVWID